LEPLKEPLKVNNDTVDSPSVSETKPTISFEQLSRDREAKIQAAWDQLHPDDQARRIFEAKLLAPHVAKFPQMALAFAIGRFEEEHLDQWPNLPRPSLETPKLAILERSQGNPITEVDRVAKEIRATATAPSGAHGDSVAAKVAAMLGDSAKNWPYHRKVMRQVRDGVLGPDDVIAALRDALKVGVRNPARFYNARIKTASGAHQPRYSARG
jgi:hypothetical protein